MKTPAMPRALANVTIARKALATAAIELAFVRHRDEPPTDASERALSIELKRICDLAHELDSCPTTRGADAPVHE